MVGLGYTRTEHLRPNLSGPVTECQLQTRGGFICPANPSLANIQGMSERFIPGFIPPAKTGQPNWWFIFQKERLLVPAGPVADPVPCLAGPEILGLKVDRPHYLGMLDGRPCYAGLVPAEVPAPEEMSWLGLRHYYGHQPEHFFWLAGRAFQILDWDRKHDFCGACGVEMRLKQDERAKECPACGAVSYPRLSPAVIVQVVRDGRILLARSPHFPKDMYSVLAGFVEPGETLEEAVEREIMEEVSISVKDVRYFGSQPWPFPDSLMIGFTAAYASGEISIDGEEIIDADWFAPDELPRLPDSISISRSLIDHFLEMEKAS